MELKKGINSNILWLLFGTLLIPTMNGALGLLNGFLKWTGLSITYRLILSVTVDSIFFLGLLYLIILALKSGRDKYSNLFDLSLRRLKVYGLTFIIIIILGRLTNYFIVTDHTKEMKILEANSRYDLLMESTYLFLTSVVISTVRDAFIFLTFLVVVFKTKE